MSVGTETTRVIMKRLDALDSRLFGVVREVLDNDYAVRQHSEHLSDIEFAELMTMPGEPARAPSLRGTAITNVRVRLEMIRNRLEQMAAHLMVAKRCLEEARNIAEHNL